MMENNIKLLDLMINDQIKQKDIYRPGPYWQRFQKRMYNAIKRQGITDFRRNPGLSGSWADAFPRDPFDLSYEWKGQLMRTLMQQPFFKNIAYRYNNRIDTYIDQLQAFKEQSYNNIFGELIEEIDRNYLIPETIHGGCEDVIKINNKRYSSYYVLFMARIFNFIEAGTHFGHIRSFMEIGGGIGGTTHLIQSLFGGVKKIIYIDIPPVIYVSTEYLRHFFGDGVIDYVSSKDLDKIEFKDDDSLEVYCLCPWQIEKIKDNSIQVLYNSASFSEMTNEIVQNYANHSKNILSHDAKICILMNKFEPHPDFDICLPDQLTAFFAPDFKFRSFEPKWELPGYITYVLGQRPEHIYQ